MQEELNILYQDEWLVAIDKPAGYLVHPTSAPQPDDQVAMKVLRDQLGKQVYTIHRIDRPTSGVLLFGIDREVSQVLHKSLEMKEMRKVYWAVVNAELNRDEWESNEPLRKDPSAQLKEAHTSFKVLDTVVHPALRDHACSALTLLEASPHTGRFHQIRRHLEAEGMPIVGDYRYGGVERCEQMGQALGIGTRMLLQAKSLELEHPVSGQHLRIDSDASVEIKRLFDSD